MGGRTPKGGRRNIQELKLKTERQVTCPEKGATSRWYRVLSAIPMSWRFVLYKLLEGSGWENDLMKPPFREMSLVGLSQE